jgi:hypothetical protein
MNQESNSLYHDSQANQIYIIEGLDSPSANLEQIMIENKVLDRGTLEFSGEHAHAFIGTLLNMQKEVFERISDSVGKLV